MMVTDTNKWIEPMAKYDAVSFNTLSISRLSSKLMTTLIAFVS
jgi:hypothetical protein